MGKSKEMFMDERAEAAPSPIEVINRIAMLAESGEMLNLEAYASLKRISDALETALETVKKGAYNELEKCEKDYKNYGYTFNCKSRGTWSYKHISSWVELDLKRKNIEELAKIAATKGVNANAETGEIIEPAVCAYSYFIEAKKS